MPEPYGRSKLWMVVSNGGGAAMFRNLSAQNVVGIPGTDMREDIRDGLYSAANIPEDRRTQAPITIRVPE